MAVYEYECERCGKAFERRTQGERLLPCPNCQSRRIKRIFTKPPAVIYKGEGFTKAIKESQ